MKGTFFEDASVKEARPPSPSAHSKDADDKPLEEKPRHDGSSGSREGSVVAREGSDDGLVADEKETEPPTRLQKVKGHFRRRWRWHLLAFIIFLAIILPINFKVIIPAVVQNVVSNQELPIFGGYFQALSPNQVLLSLNTSLYSPLPVQKDAGPLYLYNHDTVPFSPFLSPMLGQQGINKATPAIITNDTVSIGNETELVAWLSHVYDEELVQLSIRTYPLIRVGVVPTYNYLDKTIQIPGLRGLRGANVKDLQLTLPPPAQGNNLKGSIVLPNWGVIILNLGNLTLDLFSGNVKLGHVTVNDVVLPPGNTTKAFEGQIYLNELGPNLGTILASQAEPLGRGVIELNATTNSTMLNGQHIKFLETVLGTKKLPLDISVVTFLSDAISALLKGNKKSLVDVLGDVLGNSTFVERVLDNWNTTSIPPNGTSIASKVKAKRASSRASLMWTMLKFGMKMKSKM